MRETVAARSSRPGRRGRHRRPLYVIRFTYRSPGRRRPGARRRPPSRVARAVMPPAAPGSRVRRTPLALLHRRLIGPVRRNTEAPPPGTLYARLRPLLALDCLPAALAVHQPLYGEQPRPCCLPGRRVRSRSHAQLSTSHGPIFPPRKPGRTPDCHTGPVCRPAARGVPPPGGVPRAAAPRRIGRVTGSRCARLWGTRAGDRTSPDPRSRVRRVRSCRLMTALTPDLALTIGCYIYAHRCVHSEP